MSTKQTAQHIVEANNADSPARHREADRDTTQTREPYLGNHVSSTTEPEILDLYAVGKENENEKEVQPFVHNVRLLGPKGEIVRVWGMFDDSALVAAMCSRVFAKVKHRLGKYEASKRRLRMADGTIIKAEATWTGPIQIEGVHIQGSFEVFDSKGSWSFLFRKPLMKAFKVVHDYVKDKVTINGNGQTAVLHNQVEKVTHQQREHDNKVHLLEPRKPQETETPGTTTQRRKAWIEEVPDIDDETPSVTEAANKPSKLTEDPDKQQAQKIEAKAAAKRTWKKWKGTAQRRHRRWKTRAKNPPDMKHRPPSKGSETPPSRDPHTESSNPICIISEEVANHSPNRYGKEIPVDEPQKDEDIFTRKENPFQPVRVAEILKQVKIGEDLTMEQRSSVEKLITEWADIFALSVGEVLTVEGAVHTLDIPEEATFSKKVHQKPLTPPQRQYLHTKIDEMLAAGVIEQCEPSQVKCVSPTTLAQKAHEGEGLPLEELQHRINDQCIANGFEPHFQMPPRAEPTPNDEADKSKPKWRICQNFAEVNKVTKVAPMPQGDIRTKQQKLSSHRWVSLFNFAAGFYAVEVAEASRPYTAFYVEGRGYFWYAKMPFGLTGAPSTFAHMTAQHLHDLLV
jgi:hypothetical protein